MRERREKAKAKARLALALLLYLVAAETAVALFGISGPDQRIFKDVVRAIFAHTFLNLGNDPTIRDRAIRAAKLMQAWFTDEIAERRKSGQLGTDMMGQLLRNLPADDDLVRRTLGGMLVGSIDTTATSVVKIITVIGKDADLAASVNADPDDVDRLAGWCIEALRHWPHNPILMRKCVKDTSLAGTAVGKDDDIILWTHAAMYDAQALINPTTMRYDWCSSRGSGPTNANAESDGRAPRDCKRYGRKAKAAAPRLPPIVKSPQRDGR
ncbi:MAG: hypothetical protein WBF47_11945 [Xanthobacteraceae bacterium]